MEFQQSHVSVADIAAAKCPAMLLKGFIRGVTKCPELVWNENGKNWRCRLMTLAGSLGEKYKEELYAGEGCCAGLNTDRHKIPTPQDINPDSIKYPLSLEVKILLKAMASQFVSGDLITLTMFAVKAMLDEKGLNGDEFVNSATFWLKENRFRRVDDFMGEIS
jgi:hypothetical protein